MLQPAQCRAGRALLGWSNEDLALASGIDRDTIADFESGAQIPHRSALEALGRALGAGGLILIEEDVEGIGVRLRRRGPRDEGMRPDQLNSENDG